jgi:hypothetical protein
MLRSIAVMDADAGLDTFAGREKNRQLGLAKYIIYRWKERVLLKY